MSAKCQHLPSHLPLSRVNTIMKSSSDVEEVSKESSVVLAKATEMFIKNLAQEGYKETNGGKKLDYKHLANVVHADDCYDFLRDIMPKKITVAEFKKILTRKSKENGNNEDSMSSDQDSDSEDSEDSSKN